MERTKTFERLERSAARRSCTGLTRSELLRIIGKRLRTADGRLLRIICRMLE